MKIPILNIDDPESRPKRSIALLDLGFRPFFLLAGITAILLMSLWISGYTLGRLEFGYYGSALWHGHEMIFGYTVAVISGFLLTAVRNWTGIQTPHGKPLAGLVLLWLAGRIAPFIPQALPAWVIAVVDMAFLPALAIALSVSLLRSRQKHNLVFLFILAALTAANMTIHLEVLGFTQDTANYGIYFAVYLIVFLIAIISGRVIPFFTEKAIPGITTRGWPAVEHLSLGALLVMAALHLTHAAPVLVAISALLAAIGHGARLYGWYQKTVWSIPLLWVLHLGYAWLVAGFILTAMSAAGVVDKLLAIHAFTTGAIGVMTLGMMARVSLGHTGRILHVGSAMSWAFVFANLAGLSRVFLPVISPDRHRDWIILAGLFWGVAFAIFVISYVRILIQPRIDGRPG